MAEILIKNGKVIDPANGTEKIGDVLLRDGVIAGVCNAGIKHASDAEMIDATGMLVVPGLIDMHVHLREPGDEEEETIESGSAAAVAGGFTSVACMPNTDPAIDNEATVDFLYRQAATVGLANVFAVGAISKARQGNELAEMGQMVRGGAVAFSDDGNGVQNPAMMLRALKYAGMFSKVIMAHCEDKTLSGDGAMNAGYQATVLGLPGINPLAEELMLYRDVQLAKQAKTKLHAQHISTAGSVGIVRQAKSQGIKVTAEVTPHHLLLTEQACQSYDPNYKMNPPLRRQADVTSLLEAVADGTIDALASDHAPHLRSEKELEFLYAPCGIVSLDCALGLYVKALIDSKVIQWPRLIEMMTIAPANILGIDKGTLTLGKDADVTIIDTHTTWSVKVDQFRSKGRNCPYDGWQLRARPAYTIVGGEIKYAASVKNT